MRVTAVLLKQNHMNISDVCSQIWLCIVWFASSQFTVNSTLYMWASKICVLSLFSIPEHSWSVSLSFSSSSVYRALSLSPGLLVSVQGQPLHCWAVLWYWHSPLMFSEREGEGERGRERHVRLYRNRGERERHILGMVEERRKERGQGEEYKKKID